MPVSFVVRGIGADHRHDPSLRSNVCRSDAALHKWDEVAQDCVPCLIRRPCRAIAAAWSLQLLACEAAAWLAVSSVSPRPSSSVQPLGNRAACLANRCFVRCHESVCYPWPAVIDRPRASGCTLGYMARQAPALTAHKTRWHGYGRNRERFAAAMSVLRFDPHNPS